MSDLEERVRALPKIELHQHVDGSIPVDVTWELMRHYRLNPTESKDEMRRRLELQPDEEGTLLAYLDKMHYPLWITQFYENISQVTETIVDGAAGAGGGGRAGPRSTCPTPPSPPPSRPSRPASPSARCSPG